jgi:hypothetical protein
LELPSKKILGQSKITRARQIEKGRVKTQQFSRYTLLSTKKGGIVSIVWLIAKFISYTFILSVLYRQSYNLLFFLSRRPVTWIGVVSLLGIFNMVLAYALGWDPRFVSAAVITAVILNHSPSPPAGHTKEEMRTMVNEIDKELELPHGRVQAKIRLASFALFSIGSYVLLFGEVCNRGGVCTPLF